MTRREIATPAEARSGGIFIRDRTCARRPDKFLGLDGFKNLAHDYQQPENVHQQITTPGCSRGRERCGEAVNASLPSVDRHPRQTLQKDRKKKHKQIVMGI
jgi:hypothetical protein